MVDLSDDQQAALDDGGSEGLNQALEADGLWAFPSTEITEPLPRQTHVVIAEGGRQRAAVVVPATGPAHDLATRFVKAMRKDHGVEMEVTDAAAATHSLLASEDVILFGGSHENPCAMNMAMRYQTLFVDAAVPGDGGWVVATLTGLDPSGHAAVQVSASDEKADAAFAALMASVKVDGVRVVVESVHQIEMGPVMRERWTPWETFTGSITGGIVQLKGREYEIPSDAKGFSELVAAGLDSGGPDVNHYNVAPLDLSVKCAQYYLRSGDRRALELFRELLFRAADYYLLTVEGASYPADLDFRLGHMILYYARLEHDPLFTDEDRVLLANLLLACTRTVHEYALAFWPVELNGRTRHNHETFPGRTLAYGVDYFKRYGLDDLMAMFSEHAERIFTSGMYDRSKQRENAGHYESYAFEHGINYSAFRGEGLGRFRPEVLQMAVARSLAATDNFFRTSDYGDTNVSMSPAGSDKMASLVSCGLADPVYDWLGDEVFKRAPTFMPASATGSIPAIRRGGGGGRPAPSGDWEFVPVDERFIEDYATGFPTALAFDKLAFRTGWADEDHYLLFEGVGNKTISHAHLELNGIVRLNHMGRHWLVSNGYGRRVTQSNVANSFSSRIRGPEDHNMLVLERDGEVVDDFPVCAAMLQRGRQSDLLYATGAVLDVGGLDWYRTLVVLAGRFVVVVDRLHKGPDAVTTGHVEWQGLGEAVYDNGGCRLSQQGVYFDIMSAGGWPSEPAVADQSASWKGALGGGGYPYATFPLPKLLYKAPLTDGPGCRLVTLLAATLSPTPSFDIAEADDGTIQVEGDLGLLRPMLVNDGDLEIRAEDGAMEIRVGETPGLPDALKGFSATQ